MGSGRFGNAGVGILQEPARHLYPSVLRRRFLLLSGVKMRFESTFTNVLNHTN
jgi:hypothetical protein